jgi:heme/copper-type cytochrome/quinol oxidase subunit 2
MPHLVSVTLFWLSAVCAVVASLAVIWSVRPRRAGGATSASSVGDLVWAILPTLALFAILALTWRSVRT